MSNNVENVRKEQLSEEEIARRVELVQAGTELAQGSAVLRDDPATVQMVANRFVDRTGEFHDPGEWLDERMKELGDQMDNVSESRRLANIREEDLDNMNSKGTSMERE